MPFSTIASFRERQSVEEASARLGLDGLAIVAQHQAINARATRGAERILQLVEQGRHTQALALMNQPDWGISEEEYNDGSPAQEASTSGRYTAASAGPWSR